MWNKIRHKSKSARIDTLIGRQTRILGAVTFSHGMHVDGFVQGDTRAEPDAPARLSLSKSGTIEGTVSAPFVALDGVVQGDVRAGEHVQLGAHAKVTGDVYYQTIEMAVGAEVNGKLAHAPAAKQKKAGKGGAVAGDGEAAKAVRASGGRETQKT